MAKPNINKDRKVRMIASRQAARAARRPTERAELPSEPAG
jgi:hypothetical protein